MIYIAKPLQVEIHTDKLLATIPIRDSRNVLISYELDQSRTAISKLTAEYNDFITKTDLPEDQRYEQIIKLSNRLRDANIDHLKLCIKDFDDHTHILREIPSNEFADLQGAIMRAGFGMSDDDPKKKIISQGIGKSNSKRGVTRKRK